MDRIGRVAAGDDFSAMTLQDTGMLLDIGVNICFGGQYILTVLCILPHLPGVGDVESTDGLCEDGMNKNAQEETDQD